MFSLRIAIAGSMLLIATAVAAQTQRPPVGGIGSPPDAMIFYVAQGGPDTCGLGCSEWIAAEGTVQWDTHKRLFNILDRHGGRKLLLVINAWGESNLNVATSLGRILRDRGIDTMAGVTEALGCAGKPEAECLALKRQGGPLAAKMKLPDGPCDFACVLMLAGGVQRHLPGGTRVVLTGMHLHNRLAPNVSPEAREILPDRFGEQFRKYLRDMDVATELLDIVERRGGSRGGVEVPPSEWRRLKIVAP